jgi:hypothetical protein
MSYGETEFIEKGECETLYIGTAFRQDSHKSERICIGCIDKDMIGEQGTISVQIMYFDSEHWKATLVQLCPNDEEIGLIIKGLQRARSRLRSLNKSLSCNKSNKSNESNKSESGDQVMTETVMLVAGQPNASGNVVTLEALQEFAARKPREYVVEDGKLILKRPMPVEELRGDVQLVYSMSSEISKRQRDSNLLKLFEVLEKNGWEYSFSYRDSRLELGIWRKEWPSGLYDCVRIPTWKGEALETLLRAPSEKVAKMLFNTTWSVAARLAERMSQPPAYRPPVLDPENIKLESSKEDMISWIVWRRFLHSSRRPIPTGFYYKLQGLTKDELWAWIAKWMGWTEKLIKEES